MGRAIRPSLFVSPNVIIFETAVQGASRPALERFARRAQKLACVAGEVDILIADNRRLLELNRRFRGKAKATDVLSFPRNSSGNAGGNIAISAGIARQNARRYSHSLADELKILVLHGMLHLAGYDHEADDGRMARLEGQLRARLKLPASLIDRARTDTAATQPRAAVPHGSKQRGATGLHHRSRRAR
jgi:probable rRNA maturation factor